MTQTASMIFTGTRVATTLLLGLISLACGAQEFSADVAYLAAGKAGAPSAGAARLPEQSSKLYVSKDQMRLETHGLTGTVLLVNRGEGTVFALFPGQKAYQPLASGPSDYFRVEDAEDACRDWQKAANQKIACEKVGPEMLNGRRTVKYRNKGASSAATAAVWIDVALKYVVRWENARTGAELRNIKEVQQAADLFTVPSDYGVLKPRKVKSDGFTQQSQ
jgi:hypothetical protein